MAEAARAIEARVEAKTAPVTGKSVGIIAARAARLTEISATTTLTERAAAARPEVVVAAVGAPTDAMTTGAEAVTVIARTTVMTSVAPVVIRGLARDAAVVAANMTATTRDAPGLRKRAITRVAGLKSVGAAELRARTCAAATS
jgi:hypothetical protein